MPDKDRVPSYRRHSTGQAFVEFQGRRKYLGRYGSTESKIEYEQFLAAYRESNLAAARMLGLQTPQDFSIGELTAAYWQHAERYYKKNGQATSELANLKRAIRSLNDVYVGLEVREFSPIKLKQVRAAMIRKDLSRHTVNQRINQIKRVFAWGVEEELVPASVWHALLAVKPLKKGRSAARESRPIQPVADDVVDATLSALPPTIADMVRFQRLTGSRPSEVCALRPCDVNRNDPRFIVGGVQIWSYSPAGHKTEHHDRQRVVFIGPKAQELLAPYLLRAPADDAYCFTPADSERRRREIQRAERKSKVPPSQQRRGRRAKQRDLRPSYDSDSYGKAIRRAVKKINANRIKEATKAGLDPAALLPSWSPNQLRHSAATEIRRRFGAEAAQVVLGHSDLATTEIYAERDLQKAAAVIRDVG